MLPKIYVEVFIAAQLLGKQQATFTPEELQGEIVQRFGDLRVGVKTHIASHCVANVSKSAGTVYNYLWLTDGGALRLFNLQTDVPHPSRVNAAAAPDLREIPPEYRYLAAATTDKTPAMVIREVSSEGPPLLYLLKSTLTREALQENLQILAASSGETCDIHYMTRWTPPDPWGQTARWVTPDPWKNIARDEQVCLVFCDRPYRCFVPIRQGRVLDVVGEAEELILTVRLGSLANDVDLEAFSARFRGLNERRFFMVRDPAASLTFLPEGEDDRAAWRRTVDALRQPIGDSWEAPYAQTVFLRPLCLTDMERHPLDKQAALEAGKSYFQLVDCYAPHLTPTALQEHGLVLNPKGSNIRLPDSLPLVKDGEVALKIEALEPGDVALRLWVRPERAQSTALSLSYTISGISPAVLAGSPAAAAPHGSLTDHDLRAIFEVLRAPEGAVRSQAMLGLIDHVLESLSQGSLYLLEQRGLVLYELRRWHDAYNQFALLDPDRLSAQAIAAWFVSGCRCNLDTDLGAILSRFNAWEQSALVDQLIAALPMVEENRRLQILQDAWLGAGRYREMWETVKETFTRPETVLRAAELMVDPTLYHLLTPAQGYAYLRQHMETWEGAPLSFLQRAVEWGLEEPDQAVDLDDAFLCLLERLLQRGSDPTELWALADSARGLSPYTWALATEQLAEAFSSRPEPDWRAQACLFYVELARIYRERLQDLDKAEDCLGQAHLLVGDDPHLAEQVNAEESDWEAALERIDAVRIWRDGLLEIRLKRLRELLKGKRAVFVGGADRGFDIESIRQDLGLAEAEFIPYYRSERGSLNKIHEKIQQGKVDYVVDFASLGAHRNLEGYCYNADVTYIRVFHSRSMGQIVRAFALAHNIKMEA